MKEEIITKIVGQKYHSGTIGTGDKVTLVVEHDDFENHIGVYNDSDLMVGSIIHTRYDNDIVDGIANNDEIIDVIDKYDWIIIKAYKNISYVKGVLKTPNTPNYVQAMKNLINLYNHHAAMHDEESCKHIARLIKQLEIKMGE